MEPRLLQAPGLPPYSSPSPAATNAFRRKPFHKQHKYKPPGVRLPPSFPSSQPPPDPASLSPSSLAAAVHQLVKEITAQAPASPLKGGDPKAQQRQWQRQK